VLAQAVIAAKRDRRALTAAEIDAFVAGLVDGSWSDAQCAALAMAIVLNGMTGAETTALTDAMTRSGTVMDWRGAALGGPVLDKHSTGGVGDKVSLILAPLVAACGGFVPMVSGRGLGHTGGTLDKLEALPGFTVDLPPERLLDALRRAGCAIVGAGPRLAPADRRLYAVRDVTATVESIPLITASILSKKRAAGLDALVLDVKTGSGAFAARREMADALAASLVAVARAGGLACDALVTSMDAVLGTAAGNALEVREALDALAEPARAEPRLMAVTLDLASRLLVLGGLAGDDAAARSRCEAALARGAAAERFAAMVRAQGGPADVFADARLPAAPVVRPAPAPRAGIVAALDVKALGLAIVELGGGRRRGGDAVDPRVGLAAVRAPGDRVAAGEPLALVHAADEAAAAAAVRAVQAAFTLDD
jgi:thymidine phosphorylase